MYELVERDRATGPSRSDGGPSQADGGPSQDDEKSYQANTEPSEASSRSSQANVAPIGPKEDPLRLTEVHRARDIRIDKGSLRPTKDSFRPS